MIALSFTPLHAGLGGLLLGISTAAQLLLTGRVMGLSGTIKGVLIGSSGSWRVALLGGMVAVAVPLGLLMPSRFEPLPSTYSFARAIIGGLLVGVGTGLGNGCTSGHGICGNARFSLRSMVYTLTFMAAGAATAVASNAAAAAGIATSVPVHLSLPPAPVVTLALTLAAVATAAFTAISYLGNRSKTSKPFLEQAASAGSGAVFAVGLSLSGMTQPTKVIGFLSPTLPCWDPSLALVMAAALAVATPVYQHVMKRLKTSPSGGALRTLPSKPASVSNFFIPQDKDKEPVKPQLVPSFSLPTSSAVDARLLLGGLLFGAGWGLSGICPGPAIVSFAGSMGLRLRAILMGGSLMGDCLCSRAAAYIVSMLAGMLLELRLTGSSAPSRISGK